MLHFRNDYSNGAHPVIMDALCKTNLELTAGYGDDIYCHRATDLIRNRCGCPQADVHYLAGGTQANKTAIGAFLRPWEAVICADSGHIQVHEAGAIEHNGHRIFLVPGHDGKVTAQQVRKLCATFENDETSPKPQLVYISNTTEFGTVYSREELVQLRRVCDEFGLYLYCDGARLACALAVSDATWTDYGALCDCFTIGGTKNGMLFGEALVITNPALMPSFRRCMKQQGAILAKGRLMGVQFCAALEDGLYMDLARTSIASAQRLAQGLKALRIPVLIESPSNQLFPILSNRIIEKLKGEVAFEFWSSVDEENSCIRFVTAWHTAQEEVDSLLALLKKWMEEMA